MLKIKNLSISSNDNNVILKNINLEINQGETHLIIGPNGAGKSSLFKAIMNHHNYIKSGQIFFENKDITKLDTSEIAKLGIFLIHQNPVSIEGIKLSSLIKEICRIRNNDNHVAISQIKNEFIEISNLLGLNEDIYNRDINLNLSGGEQKKAELIHMYFAKPKLCLIDEIDSGLDITSIKIVGNFIKELQKKYNLAIIIISHQKDILEILSVDKVHIIRHKQMITNKPKEIIYEIIQKGWNCDTCTKYGIECC